MPPTTQPNGTQTSWVLILSLLAGSGWLLIDAYPSTLSFPFPGCIHFALIALSGLVIATRRGWEPWPPGLLTDILLAGLCVFLLPSAASEFATGEVAPFTIVALFCAIPVFTAVASAIFAATTQRQLLWPALIGLLGALFLFPAAIPSTTRGELLFALLVAACIVIAIATVRIHAILSKVPVAQAVAVISLAASVLLGLYGLKAGWPHISTHTLEVETLRCIVFDLPFVWLLTWLSREVQTARLSSRFLFTPLVTVLEAYAVIRTAPDTRKIIALALMAAGALLLLFKIEPEDTPSLHLR